VPALCAWGPNRAGQLAWAMWPAKWAEKWAAEQNCTQSLFILVGPQNGPRGGPANSAQKKASSKKKITYWVYYDQKSSDVLEISNVGPRYLDTRT